MKMYLDGFVVQVALNISFNHTDAHMLASWVANNTVTKYRKGIMRVYILLIIDFAASDCLSLMDFI